MGNAVSSWYGKKMKLICLICSTAFAGLLILAPPKIVSGAFTPRSLTAIQLWLDSADVLNGSNPPHNTKFATWNDKSGNGYNYTQATSGNQFTYGAAQVNAKDVVVADRSANTYMSNTRQFMNTGSAFTIFYTVEVTDLTPGFAYIGTLRNAASTSAVIGLTSADFRFIANGSWTGSLWNASISTSAVYMFTIGYNGSGATTTSNYFAKQNGSLLTFNGPDVGAAGAHSAVGSDVDDPGIALNGYILDFVFQGAAASPTEESQMLSYEQAKWNF